MERRRILQASSSCTNSSKRKPFAWRIGGSLPMTSTIGGFFDTNDLAAICMENEAVFQATHRLIWIMWHKEKWMACASIIPTGCMIRLKYFERLKRSIAEGRRATLKRRQRFSLLWYRENSYWLGTAARPVAGLRHDRLRFFESGERFVC